MNIEEIRSYCLELSLVSEDMPFGDDTIVFRIKGKIFALLNLQQPFGINLKCDPVLAVQLREEYEYVLPGYHMNKKHWNTIDLSFDIPNDKLKEWIKNSYELVIKKLTKREREELEKEMKNKR